MPVCLLQAGNTIIQQQKIDKCKHYNVSMTNTNVNNNACVTNINAQIPSPQDGQRLPIAYN